MKKEYNRPSNKPLIAYRSTMVLFLVLVVLLAVGSLYALLRPPNSGPLFRLGGKTQKTVVGTAIGDATGIFSGIRNLRIPLAVEPAAILVLSISFPYPAEDRPFAEELASHVGEFRSIATDYFSSLTGEKAVNPDEDAAKTEILKRYNAILRLGKIETLYFGDLMIVD
jgi:flagellar basal body-associated protein FliL